MALQQAGDPGPAAVEAALQLLKTMPHSVPLLRCVVSVWQTRTLDPARWCFPQCHRSALSHDAVMVGVVRAPLNPRSRAVTAGHDGCTGKGIPPCQCT